MIQIENMMTRETNCEQYDLLLPSSTDLGTLMDLYPQCASSSYVKSIDFSSEVLDFDDQVIAQDIDEIGELFDSLEQDVEDAKNIDDLSDLLDNFTSEMTSTVLDFSNFTTENNDIDDDGDVAMEMDLIELDHVESLKTTENDENNDISMTEDSESDVDDEEDEDDYDDESDSDRDSVYNLSPSSSPTRTHTVVINIGNENKSISPSGRSLLSLSPIDPRCCIQNSLFPNVDSRIPIASIPRIDLSFKPLQTITFKPHSTPITKVAVPPKQTICKKKKPTYTHDEKTCWICQSKTSSHRKRALHRYVEKRSRRIWKRGPRYEARSSVASNRTRQGGRFVTKCKWVNA